MLSQAQIDAVTQAVYLARRERRVNPEGYFDLAGVRQPSAREDAAGDISRAWLALTGRPRSMLSLCRARQHCAEMVNRALAGDDVPDDVIAGFRAVLKWANDAPFGVLRDYVMEGCPHGA